MSARRGPSVCAQPGCPRLVDSGSRCPTHKAKGERDASRRRRAQQGTAPYDLSAWQKRRDAYRRTHPTCVRCSAATSDVDHVIPRRVLLAAGVTNPDTDQWLQPLCHACHARKTATIDKPLLRRLDAGEDPAKLADEVLR